MDLSRSLHHASFMRRFWRGRYETRWQHYSLFVGSLGAMILCQSMFVLALSFMWREMLLARVLAAMLVGLAILLLILGLRALLYTCFHLGLQRLLVVLPGLFVCLVLIFGIATSGNKQSVGHWTASLQTAWSYVRREPHLLWSTLLSAPHNIRLARLGTSFRLADTDRLPQIAYTDRLPAETPEPDAQPGLHEQPSEPTPPPLAVGTSAYVVRTGNLALRARQDPSLTAPIVHRFRQGTVVSIIAGPITADGFTWWQVEHQGQTGWCAQDYLDAAE